MGPIFVFCHFMPLQVVWTGVKWPPVCLCFLSFLAVQLSFQASFCFFQGLVPNVAAILFNSVFSSKLLQPF